jgi:hypothetical protein
MHSAEPSSTGLQMPSSAKIFAARTIFSDSPSGKTIRFGSAIAWSNTPCMTRRVRDSRVSSSRT